jgi:hypothetical protein
MSLIVKSKIQINLIYFRLNIKRNIFLFIILFAAKLIYMEIIFAQFNLKF